MSHEVYIVAATCSGLWLWLEEQAKIDWTCRCCACSIALCLLLFSCSVRLSWDKRRRRLQKGAILTDESGWPKGSPNERLNQDRGKCRRVCFRLSSYLNSSGSPCVCDYRMIFFMLLSGASFEINLCPSRLCTSLAINQLYHSTTLFYDMVLQFYGIITTYVCLLK